MFREIWKFSLMQWSMVTALASVMARLPLSSGAAFGYHRIK